MPKHVAKQASFAAVVAAKTKTVTINIPAEDYEFLCEYVGDRYDGLVAVSTFIATELRCHVVTLRQKGAPTDEK